MSLCFELSMVLCHMEVVVGGRRGVGGGGGGGWGQVSLYRV